MTVSSHADGAAEPSRADFVTEKKARRKLLTAGLTGSTIEWYDFFLYGTAAALIFPRVFFPEMTPLMGVLLSFGTFWAGFLARPIGGLLAGHFGDRYGRKPTVVVCLSGMALGTFLIGCLPEAGTVGILAPLLLVLLRFVQGLAAGGQWGGIMLLLTESGDPKKRGFAGTFGQTSVPVAIIVVNVLFIGVSTLLPEDTFFSWGWRIPFLLSALMFPVVLYIQTRVEDTPEFVALQKNVDSRQQRVIKAPIGEVIRRHWKTIILGCGLMAATNSLFYVSVAGLLSYAVDVLHMQRSAMLATIVLCSVVMIVVLPLAGAISDRIGRRPLILIGGLGVAAWAYPYFWLVDTGSLVAVFFAISVGYVFQGFTYGPMAAFLGELFAPNVRYSGASAAYQLSAIVVSGATPILMTASIARTGSTHLFAVFIVLMGLATFLSAWLLPETNPAEVRADPKAIPGAQLHTS